MQGINISKLVHRTAALFSMLGGPELKEKGWLSYETECPDLDAVAILMWLKQNKMLDFSIHISPIQPGAGKWEIMITKLEPLGDEPVKEKEVAH